MSGDLVTIERDFNGETLTLIEREDGSLWFTADELTRALGYSDATKFHQLVNRHLEEIGSLRRRIVSAEVSKDGAAREVVIFEERAVYLLACFARTPKGAAFRQWVVSTCHDLRTREKILVDREEHEEQRTLLITMLHAYEVQANANTAIASMAGRVLALRRQTKPKGDPRQLVFPAMRFEEIEAKPEPPERTADGAHAAGA